MADETMIDVIAENDSPPSEAEFNAAVGEGGGDSEGLDASRDAGTVPDGGAVGPGDPRVGGNEGEMIPRSALDGVIRRLDARSAELANYKSQVEEIDRQRRLVEEAWTQDQRAAAVPAKEEDPVGYLEAQIRALGEGQQQTQARIEQAQQAQQEREYADYVNGVRDWLSQDTEQFMATEAPDYQAAVAYWRSSDVQRRMMTGVPEETAWERSDQYMYQAALNAYAQGQSPARLLYAVAQQYGYQPQAGGAAEQVPVPYQGLSTSRPLSTLAARRELQHDSASLSGVGGQPSTLSTAPELDDIAGDPAKIDQFLASLPFDGDADEAIRRMYNS